MNTLNRQETWFAANVALVRKALPMSQEELAAKVGVGRSAIQAVEAGNRRIRLGEACDIAKALGVSLDDLLCEHLTVQVSIGQQALIVRNAS